MKKIKFMTKNKKLNDLNGFKICSDDKCYRMLINNKKYKPLPFECFNDNENIIKNICTFCRERNKSSENK